MKSTTYITPKTNWLQEDTIDSILISVSGNTGGSGGIGDGGNASESGPNPPDPESRMQNIWDIEW